MKTGWPPGLLQDDDRKLSRWFASRPGARYQVRMNMTEQPVALRLADEYDSDHWIVGTKQWCGEAAAELRHLHEVKERLLRERAIFLEAATRDTARITKLTEANAELLEALKTCVCAMQDYQAGIGITEMFDAGERMGRAALAKHGGEA